MAEKHLKKHKENNEEIGRKRRRPSPLRMVL
jgi:hypothetical protein